MLRVSCVVRMEEGEHAVVAVVVVQLVWLGRGIGRAASRERHRQNKGCERSHGFLSASRLPFPFPFQHFRSRSVIHQTTSTGYGNSYRAVLLQLDSDVNPLPLCPLPQMADKMQQRRKSLWHRGDDSARGMVPGARKSFASVAPAPAPGGTSQTNLIGHRRTSAISAELFPMYVLPLKRLRDLYGAYDPRTQGGATAVPHR